MNEESIHCGKYPLDQKQRASNEQVTNRSSSDNLKEKNIQREYVELIISKVYNIVTNI